MSAGQASAFAMTIRRTVPLLLVLAVMGICLALSFGFLGRLHMALDSFSHFRIHLAAILAAMGIALMAWRTWRLAGAAAIMAAAAAVFVTIGPGKLAGPPTVSAGDMPASGPRYRLLQLNLRYDNSSPEKVLSLIGRTMADIVTLDEVPARWREKLELIGAAYPYRVICPPPSDIGGVAILSRRPFDLAEKPRCYDRGSFAIAAVDFGGRTVSIAALHLGWPWPFDQPDQLDAIGRALKTKLSHTALLAGDFNAAPWSQTVSRVAQAGGLKVVRGIGPTWLALGFPNVLRRRIGLPIDNLLAKGDIVLAAPRRLGYVGSDHLPVLIEFALTPEAEMPEAMQAALGQSAGRQ